MGRRSPAMERFATEFCRREPRARLAGIDPSTPNAPGYHNSRDRLLAIGLTNDYSVRHPVDRGGPGDMYAGLDISFTDAQSGDYTTIRRYMTRLKEAFDRRDPRLNGWREALGQQDSDGNPEGFDFLLWSTRTPDMSHMWHIHLSALRQFVDDWFIYENLLDILFPSPVGGDAPNGDEDMGALDRNGWTSETDAAAGTRGDRILLADVWAWTADLGRRVAALTTDVAALKDRPAAQVTVDASAVREALSHPDFLAKLAKAVNDDAARRAAE